MTPTWPRGWGPNTPSERARFLCRVYRDAALSDTPAEAVETADRVARAYRELWLFPRIDTADDGWISIDEFAAQAGRSVKTVWGWYNRFPPAWGTPPVRVEGRVQQAEVDEFLAARDGIQEAA